MKALITGITGQDGSYLAELLLEKDWEVHGVIRRSSSFNTQRIDHIFDDLHLHHGDVLDASRISSLIHQIRPDHIYNLAAQSHVKVSFDAPVYTSEVSGIGAVNVLEAAVSLNRVRPVKFYQASSSEMYGRVLESPQTERTPFNPVSPYACAKVYAHYMTRNYRDAHQLFACCGILMNHESPRRGETFVTRKVTRAIGEIVAGKRKKVGLGNLAASRDWGYAPEYVEAMHLMMCQDQPGDYVIATGESHTVREFVETAFECAGLEWQQHVDEDERQYRGPSEVHHLLGDATLAKERLGWTPKTKFKDLVKLMVESDLT